MAEIGYRDDRLATATDDTLAAVLAQQGCLNVRAATREFRANGVTKFYSWDGYECGRPSTAVTVRRVTA